LAGRNQTLKQAIDALNSNGYFLTAASIAISDSSDLNNYKTPGRYLCVNSAKAKTLQNCPVEVGFTLRVEIMGADWIRQILDVAASASIIQWQRILSPATNTWSNWVSFSFIN